MDIEKKYWFPAKRYGWGWSFPARWQGWAVFVAYAASLVLLRHFLPPARDHALFFAGIAVSTAILLAVCWLKGEPPSSRRGQ
ncbi:hypothetical protein SAMN05428972_0871 [Rhodanobacter sp. OK091]|nr:hypothetical protein SAMN05428972_0871 [Rhodanobacter sp. OK091]